jgi:hypothetical protein
LLSRAIELSPRDSAARQELEPSLRDVLFASGELKWARISWASVRCFWRWRLGHKWVTTERLGEVMLRCLDCDKAKRLAVPSQDERERLSREHQRWKGPLDSGGGE